MHTLHRAMMAGLVAAGLSIPAVAMDTTNIGLQPSLGAIHSAHIVVEDQISDGCWLTPASAKNRVTAKLEQAGIQTYEERLLFYNGFWVMLEINGLGYRTDGGTCIGSLRFNVQALEDRTMGSEEYTGGTWTVKDIPSTLFHRHVLLSGGEDLSRRITDAVDSFTDELITRVYAGRRDPDVSEWIDAFDGLTQDAMTLHKFNKMVEDTLSEMSSNP